MKYDEARPLIRTGDLIAVRKKSGFLPILTRLITGSPYTHTATALWVESRLLVVEAKASGAFLTPLSQYATIDFDVYLQPLGLSDVEATIWETLGVPLHYDVPDLVRIGLNKLLGVPLPRQDDANKVCSSLSAALWRWSGWKPQGLPSLPAPCDVVAALGGPPFLEVRPA